MPITKSAKKAARQSAGRRERNQVQKKNLKKKMKDIRGLVSGGEFGKAKETISEVYKTIDKAAKTGLIKKNTASRKKSRITKLINKG